MHITSDGNPKKPYKCDQWQERFSRELKIMRETWKSKIILGFILILVRANYNHKIKR